MFLGEFRLALFHVLFPAVDEIFFDTGVGLVGVVFHGFSESFEIGAEHVWKFGVAHGLLHDGVNCAAHVFI